MLIESRAASLQSLSLQSVVALPEDARLWRIVGYSD